MNSRRLSDDIEDYISMDQTREMDEEDEIGFPSTSTGRRNPRIRGFDPNLNIPHTISLEADENESDTFIERRYQLFSYAPTNRSIFLRMISDEMRDEGPIDTELEEEEEKKGLSEEDINRIPKIKIKSKTSSCSICFNKYRLDDEARKLPCSHVFHDDCIMPWLQQSDTCPLCRMNIKLSLNE